VTAPPRGDQISDRSLDHLLARLDLLSARVEAAVARRRAADSDPDDRFRGLYLSDTTVDQLLAGRRASLWSPSLEQLSASVEQRADEWEAEGTELRLRRLGPVFGLDLIDIDILLVALAPDVDPRFERLYGYLHDDVTRRRASIGLALELSGIVPSSADGRARLGPSAQLVSAGLLVIEDRDRPVLTRSLRVPDRVSAHLLGDESLDPDVAEMVIDQTGGPGAAWPPLDIALARAVTPIYLREPLGTSAAWAAASAAARAGRESLVVDLARVATAADALATATLLVREARLRNRVLIGIRVEALLERAAGAIELLADAPGQVVLGGSRPWDPGWARAVPLLLEVPQPTPDDRAAQWATALNGHAADPALLKATLAFRLTPLQVARAAQATKITAIANDREVEARDVQAAARAQNAAGLDRLAHRVEPRAAWDQLVLPPDVRIQLHELSARARHRERVLDEWGIGGRALRGSGITTLFAGDSGTGKTLSAEVIAGELGLELYVIDLSTVVDKYIGETEKNLDRIFAEADRVNGVLLFDEADAIFGKRSEVRDARDRYANVEVAYLLQRMERFDGLAVLTTNLRANLDEAFIRRIDVIVDFPMPEEDDRLRLWRLHLPPAVPQAGDLDLRFMADRFRLSGGHIRNICVTAAYFAAEAERPLSMADLVRATEREYRKLGRLTVEAEFGPYLALTRT
jgi:ATPase family associated with various cellular activities (AAA)